MLQLAPRVDLIEELDQSGLSKKEARRQRWEREQFHIKRLRADGEELLNQKTGVSKGFIRGPSKLKGRPLNPEHREKHVARLKAFAQTEAGREHVRMMHEKRRQKAAERRANS